MGVWNEENALENALAEKSAFKVINDSWSQYSWLTGRHPPNSKFWYTRQHTKKADQAAESRSSKEKQFSADLLGPLATETLYQEYNYGPLVIIRIDTQADLIYWRNPIDIRVGSRWCIMCNVCAQPRPWHVWQPFLAKMFSNVAILLQICCRSWAGLISLIFWLAGTK